MTTLKQLHVYLHTIMSLACHRTMTFSMPFIFTWVEFWNGNLTRRPPLDNWNSHSTSPKCNWAWWNVMSTTPHTRLKVHGTQLARSRSSTFVLSFRWVGYKQVKHCFSKFYRCSPWHTKEIQQTFNLISLFQYEAQSSYFFFK